ncbi:hypothetical protein D3C85_1203480 [compost metagenome]
MLLAGAIGGVLGDDQASRAVVRVDTVDQVVAVGIALEYHVIGFVAVEAVPHVVEHRVNQPAAGMVALHGRMHRRAVLGDGYAIGLARGVTKTRYHRVDDVGLGTAPSVEEGAELALLLEPVLLVFRLAPGGKAGVHDEQLTVVDQERAALAG